MLASCAEKSSLETDSIVLYYSQNAETRQAAKLVAEKSGSTLFDIAGKQTLPDLMKYRFYYIGFPVINTEIAPQMQTFLSGTDFFDGIILPFWTGADNNADYSSLVEKLIYRPRMISGSGFTDVSFFNMKTVGEQVDTWLATVTVQIDVLRSAGEWAEAVMKAFAAAYPDRLGQAVLCNGDWAVQMDGEQYYYAQGKFLSENEVKQAADFRPQRIYRYTTEFAGDTSENNAWKAAAAELFWRRTVFSGTVARGYTYSSGSIRSSFYEKLLQCETREEAFAHQKIITFLRSTVTVHERIVAPLARVEQRINELEKTDAEITAWKKSLDSITAWNWRNIASSSNRSFHAYGIAIDLLMKLQQGKETYWLWTRGKGIDWRTVPEEDKLNPPRSVIRAFEEEGFIWGGKWPWYDTMHFEYHPELILLSIDS
ncbi:MAG: M15 family metallopeptidase [Treponema sp.]|nr:M15 family metallopeptidase [Treponema sp.]